MKTSFISASMLLLLFTIVMTGCSKKNLAIQSDLHKTYVQEVESRHTKSFLAEATTSDDKTTSAAENTEVNSININIPQKENSVADNTQKNISYNKEKQLGKNSLLTKILIKKIEKSMKKQNLAAPHQATGPLRTGIILGAVGLLLLITAGFFGPASPLIYVSGAVLFVVGVVLILVSVL